MNHKGKVISIVEVEQQSGGQQSNSGSNSAQQGGSTEGNDATNNVPYAILADYLPSNNVALTTAGFDAKSGDYAIWIDGERTIEVTVCG